MARLTSENRESLVRAMLHADLGVTGVAGYKKAEVTAGGVDLSEVRQAAMESRIVPGLHLCGEILDVDGRIGGFNFQWAWSSGWIAGSAAAKALL
jgi:predicted flavoprotein YhiN